MKVYRAKRLLNFDNNAKTVKGQKYKYLTGILYLAPARTSGFNVCPMASAGCKASCLFTAGRGRFSNVYNGRLNKTLWYFLERESFLNKLRREINALIKKAKRLKLVEVVHLLREITNIEMDLRFEAAAANELYENTKLDNGFNVPKIYWNYTTKRILTLDKVEGVSIREHEKLKQQGINLKNLAENLIQHFLK